MVSQLEHVAQHSRELGAFLRYIREDDKGEN